MNLGGALSDLVQGCRGIPLLEDGPRPPWGSLSMNGSPCSMGLLLSRLGGLAGATFPGMVPQHLQSVQREPTRSTSSSTSRNLPNRCPALGSLEAQTEEEGMALTLWGRAAKEGTQVTEMGHPYSIRLCSVQSPRVCIDGDLGQSRSFQRWI